MRSPSEDVGALAATGGNDRGVEPVAQIRRRFGSMTSSSAIALIPAPPSP